MGECAGCGLCRPLCCADLQPLLAVSVWRPVQRELLQTHLPSSRLLLVLSSDTAPTTAHNCPPDFPPDFFFFATCSAFSRRVHGPPENWCRGWKLKLTSSCSRERGKQRHVLCGWGGNGTLPCHVWPVLFSLHPNKDTTTTRLECDNKPK